MKPRIELGLLQRVSELERVCLPNFRKGDLVYSTKAATKPGLFKEQKEGIVISYPPKHSDVRFIKVRVKPNKTAGLFSINFWSLSKKD